MKIFRSPALAIAGLLAFASRLAAINSTWEGDFSNKWNSSQNWSAGVPGANDTAIFSSVAAGNSTTPVIDFNLVTEIGTVFFQSGAPAFQIQVSASNLNDPVPQFIFDIKGTGIVNSSSNAQSLSNSGGAGDATSTGGRTELLNNALISAGAGFTITNQPSSLGGAGSLALLNASTLGDATVVNVGGRSAGYTLLDDSANAGAATITNGRGIFDGAGGFTVFFGDTSANNANITNQGGDDFDIEGGNTEFSSTASLGNATITNQGGSNGGAGGRTLFILSASASSGQILTNGGSGNFSTGGLTEFRDTTTAGTASITTSGGIFGGAGGMTLFQDSATASGALLTTNGGIFGGTGGVTKFIGNASGGNATVVTNSGGTFDISGLATSGTTAGSIAGAGSYVLGNKELTVGGNNTTTTVSGVISGTGGSLTKNGIGTLTLSGVNTFTSGVTLNAGGLNVNNSSALGSGLLLILGGTLGSTNSAQNISNAVNIFANVEMAPLDTAAGQLSFTGPVNLGGVTHIISSDSAGQTVFSTAISGSAGVTFQGIGAATGRFAFLGSTSNTYAGTTNVGVGATLTLNKSAGATAIPGNLTVNFGGTAILQQSEQIANAAVLSVNGTFALGGLNETIGGLNGSGNVTLQGGGVAGTLQVGTGAFTGAITSGGLSGGGLTKSGAGTLTLSGASTYDGSTTIQSGQLIAANSIGSATGTSVVFVSPGGTLGGDNANSTTGFVGGLVRVFDNGHIAPGLVGLAGKLTLRDDLTLSNASQLDFQLRQSNAFNSPDDDLLKILGDLTLDGVLNVDATLGFGGQGDYLLMTYLGALTDGGLNIGIVPSGFNANQFLIDVSKSGAIFLHVVPEPSSLVLLLFASALAGAVRWRRS